MDELLRGPQVVSELFDNKVDIATLARWRREKVGPPFIRLQGRILYRRGDVASWIEQSTVRANAA
jgi:hypothetical protein